MGRLGGALRAVIVALGLWWSMPGAHADQPLDEVMARARTEARNWQRDATLVQMELTGFGFATGASGIPDMTRAGPPKLAMFTFVSPSVPRSVLRVSIRINETPLPPAQQQARIAMGYKTVMVDMLPPPAPFSLPIAANLAGTFQHAVARATEDIGKECARANPKTNASCQLVQGAELHMHRRDAGDTTGIPVWTIGFGQHPRLADDVSRVVEATTGKILARNIRSRFPTGVIPSIGATVVGLRFFVGLADPPPLGQRSYDDFFFYNAARYIHWELNLVHPAPGRRVSFTVHAVWADGAFRETPRVFTLEPNATASQFTGGANLQQTKTVVTANPIYEMCEGERSRERSRRERQGLPSLPSSPCPQTQAVDIHIWPMGGYPVELFVDGQRIAAGSFDMKDKEYIYGEVRARSRDQSAPTGEIGHLGARVTSLRFFEVDPSASPRAPRRYASQFPRSTAHAIGWQLDLKHEPPGRWLELPLEALLYHAGAGGERIVQRKVLQTAVPAEWANTQHWDAFGWDNVYYYDRSGATTPSPRSWLPGVYRVDLFAGGRGPNAYKVASGSFEIR